jgi:hypothetical protein
MVSNSVQLKIVDLKSKYNNQWRCQEPRPGGSNFKNLINNYNIYSKNYIVLNK